MIDNLNTHRVALHGAARSLWKRDSPLETSSYRLDMRMATALL